MKPAGRGADGTKIPGLDALLAADDAVGVLARDVRMELVNLSASGCLLRSTRWLEPGTTGTLRVHVDGATFTDGIRVVRVQEQPGAGWHVGVEFVWTTLPDAGSLRRMAQRIAREATHRRVELEIDGPRFM